MGIIGSHMNITSEGGGHQALLAEFLLMLLTVIGLYQDESGGRKNSRFPAFSEWRI